MPNLPCPNPTCTHQFTPTDVRGATALTCPRCGTVFQFRQGAKPGRPVPAGKASPPPPAAIPVAQPVRSPMAPPPLARPATVNQPAVKPPPPIVAAPPAAARPVPVPAAEPPPPRDSGSPAPLVRARPRRESSPVKVLTMGVAGLLVAAGAVAAFLIFRERVVPPKDTVLTAGGTDKYVGYLRNLKGNDEAVLQITAPKKTWKMATAIGNGLKSSATAASGMGILALQRSDHSGSEPRDAWLAAAARDFGFRKPREAELVKDAIERLETLFGDTLELAEKTRTRTFAGHHAQTLEFKGTFKQVVWRGECLMMTRHGIGYWLFIAGPTLQGATRELDELEQDNRGFAMVDERRGWREQPPKMATYTSDKIVLSVTAPEGVWEKKDVTEVDESGVLLLYGRYLQEKDNRKNAHVLAAALERQGSAGEGLKAAAAHFEDEKKKDNKDYQFEKMHEGAVQVGDRQVAYAEIKVQLGTQPTRYFLVAALANEANTVGILCDSTWESRQIWRQDFLDLLKTIRLGKQ